MHKLDDLSRDFRSGSPAVPIYATSDLATLVNIVIGDSKGAVDGAASIKALWLGKSQTALQEARERSKHDTDGDLSDRTSDDDDREPRSRFSPSRRQRAMDNWRRYFFAGLDRDLLLTMVQLGFHHFTNLKIQEEHRYHI